VLRQLRGEDRLGRGAAVKSRASEQLRARTVDADRVVKSVCPYCAVGCAQKVYVKDGKAVQIEGDPDAPHSRGRLCPKGSATLQLTTGDSREQHVLYRRPYGSEWSVLTWRRRWTWSPINSPAIELRAGSGRAKATARAAA
jgi:formate dehydrogenase major subunit